MLISCFKIRENAIAPDRAHSSDAGMDVFYCFDPEDARNSKDTGIVDLEPGENHMFKTGLKFGIPHGYMLQVCNRGSMGAKRSLIVGAHIIDSGYAGEVLIDLHNIGTGKQTINHGDKIAQLVMMPVIHAIPLIAKNEESLYDMEQITMSDRGEGKLGSTKKKKA